MGDSSPNIIANSFLSCADHNGEGEAIVFGERRIKWREFVPRVFRVANALVGLGVKKDDKVAFMFHNTPEFLEVNFGIQAAGAVPAPMNYRFTPREIEYQGNHCDARVFLYDSIWAEAVEAAAPRLENITHFVRRGEGGLKQALDYEGLLGDSADTDPRVANEWDDLAVMVYTGGTTGFPKGVMLSYQAHLDMFAMLFSALLTRALSMEVPVERHQRIVEAVHTAGKPVILHSCGHFDRILDDMVAMGVDGRHSYEDTILPVEQAYELYRDKFAIIGGIDVDFICRAEPEEVYERAKALLEQTANRGGYALGTGNSVPDYVPDENYFAMIRAALETR